MKKCVHIAFALVALLIIVSCNKRPPSAPDPAPAVYYWRTTLQLDSTESSFLSQHHIEKFYLRFFDVVMRDDKPMPNATLKVVDSLPHGLSLIPTIFITEPFVTSAVVCKTAPFSMVKLLEFFTTPPKFPYACVAFERELTTVVPSVK